MGTEYERLQENLAERRTRADEAVEVVAGLKSLGAEKVADTVAGWMEQAYSVKASVGLAPKGSRLAVRVLDRGEGRTLLAVLGGDATMTWADIDAAADAAWGVHADSTIVASLNWVDPELSRENEERQVRLYGREQLETIYREIEHEVGGITLS
jgi:hypothetical protein